MILHYPIYLWTERQWPIACTGNYYQDISIFRLTQSWYRERQELRSGRKEEPWQLLLVDDCF